jgi:hypothetical protein
MRKFLNMLLDALILPFMEGSLVPAPSEADLRWWYNEKVFNERRVA